MIKLKDMFKKPIKLSCEEFLGKYGLSNTDVEFTLIEEKVVYIKGFIYDGSEFTIINLINGNCLETSMQIGEEHIFKVSHQVPDFKDIVEEIENVDFSKSYFTSFPAFKSFFEHKIINWQQPSSPHYCGLFIAFQ